MRLLVIVLVASPLWLLAQQKDYYQSSGDTISVKSLLSIIHEDGSILISYDPEIIPPDEIFIPRGDWSMLDLLRLITDDTVLAFKRVGKSYILTRASPPLYQISGFVSDSQTGERLIGALVRVSGTTQGVITNTYGFYSLEVPIDKDSIDVSYLGYQQKRINLPGKEQEILIDLEPSISMLQTIVIEDQSYDVLPDPQFGHIQLRPGQFDTPLGALGERDLMRQLQQTAGIAMTSESSSGFSVRGGRPNQNLILLDEAVVYNPTHFVGFFSIFNADALNKVDVYKGGMPARYGGRLASVTNVMMKEGNNQRWSGNGNVNFLATSLSLEGPLKKDKGSLILSGRKSYADLLLFDLSETRLSFFDINLKLNYQLSPKDRLYVSGYFGEDRFRLPDFSVNFNWGNATFTFRWNHVFTQKLFSNTSFISSNYNYNLRASALDLTLDWLTDLQSHTLKTDFSYFKNNRTQINFGASATYHLISPAFLSLQDQNNPTASESGELNQSRGLENAIYLELEHELSQKLSILSGIRVTTFHNIGPGTQFFFDSEFNTINTIQRGTAAFYHTYFNIEPRVSLNYHINGLSSTKASYNRAVQYISQASNSLSGSPLDVWFLASPNVQPQVADQISLGYFQRFHRSSYELSLETFYRRIDNEIDFKDNAELLLNEELEAELRIGRATSYGVELSLSKISGRLRGNANLTISRSFLDIPMVNQGLQYPSTYDRPINFSVSPTYQINERINLNMSWVFFSGLPFTSPTGRFNIGNVVIPSFSNRNADRLPYYHRLDLALEYEGKHKKNKKFQSSWALAIYNIYNRLNANFITFRTVEGTNQSEAVLFTIFGIVPSVAYRFKF